MPTADVNRTWRDIAASFLKIGATAYGGPAIMGVMQAELQERRLWLSKERFVEGLSLVNMVPGATATQLAIFLGYVRAGAWGGVLAGVCFVLPGFAIMLALTILYASLGVSPIMRGALYGLGPVVLGIYLVAVYRLSRTTVGSISQALLALAAAAAAAWSPLGVAAILLLAGGAGLWLFHSRRTGAMAIAALVVALGALSYGFRVSPGGVPTGSGDATLAQIGVFLFTVGAFTFGGGLTMIAFIQEQVVNQFQWLTAQEFIDGLALGQFTPGPVLVVAAYVGYKVAGIAGAAVGAAAAFLPSFVLMLALLPVFDRVRGQVWIRPAMRGIGPAVIGALAVSLLRLAPHAMPDAFAVVIFVATVTALLYWRIGAMKIMLAGAVLGMLRSRWSWLQAARSALSAGVGPRF
jgi:chromate transporter